MLQEKRSSGTYGLHNVLQLTWLSATYYDATHTYRAHIMQTPTHTQIQ